MSAETLERLRAAIEAHIHDEQPGHHPLAWLLATNTLDVSTGDADGYRFDTDGNIYTTMGLAHAYLHTLDREATNDDD